MNEIIRIGVPLLYGAITALILFSFDIAVIYAFAIGLPIIIFLSII